MIEEGGIRRMVSMVMFDLPTGTKSNLKKYTRFKKEILGYGFIMFQYSVYVKFCNSLSISRKYEKKLTKISPKNGLICIIRITESQYKNMITVRKKEKKDDFINKNTQLIMEF